jgi:DNA-binding CsgD family transcriptional regulator
VSRNVINFFKDRVFNYSSTQGYQTYEMSISNEWGDFSLYAFNFIDVRPENAPLIGIYIRWQEPFVLKLFHRIPILNLTPRQETVALHYAIGESYQSIANILNLSLYTINEHIRNIYDELGVSSRAELLEVILCKPFKKPS